MRRSVPVHAYSQIKIGYSVQIRPDYDCSSIDPPLIGFNLLNQAGTERIAHCASAKRLSDWAFEHGCSEVRHDYDLRLSDGEP